MASRCSPNEANSFDPFTPSRLRHSRQVLLSSMRRMACDTERYASPVLVISRTAIVFQDGLGEASKRGGNNIRCAIVMAPAIQWEQLMGFLLDREVLFLICDLIAIIDAAVANGNRKDIVGQLMRLASVHADDLLVRLKAYAKALETLH